MAEIESPFEKINAEPAVKALSKTQSGALFIIVMAILAFLIGAIVFLANKTSDKPAYDCAKEMEQIRAHYEREINRILALANVEHKENDMLKDSLSQMNFLQNFNATEGRKFIILKPKKAK